MREIKFRFWGNFGELNEEDDVCEEEMLYGDKFCFFESEPINSLFACRNFKVMQFTGLKDSENVDVYEDDIIQYSNGVKAVVKWMQDECFGRNYDGYSFRSDENTFKVIGNIHENTGLL